MRDVLLNLLTNIWERLKTLKDPKVRIRTALYSGAAIMIGLFIFAIAMPLTSHPTFCGKVCHSMRREYFTWKKSSHSNITCTACHVEQGLIPFFFEKVEGPLGIIAEITGNYERPVNTESELGFEHISRDVCERCHNMENRKVSPSRIFSEKMYGSGDKYHKKHLKKKIPCTLCHNRVTHKDVNEPEILKEAGYAPDSEEAKREYENGLSMTEGCFRCHAPDPAKRDKALVKKYQAQKAPKVCTNCHTRSLLPVGHKDNDWRTEHPKYMKEKGINYCLRCHNSTARFTFEGKIYCTRCHAEKLVNSWR